MESLDTATSEMPSVSSPDDADVCSTGGMRIGRGNRSVMLSIVSAYV
jgi:hypothetical protein